MTKVNRSDIQQTILQKAEENFPLAYPSYQPQREAILKAFRELLDLKNVEGVFAPQRFLKDVDFSEMERQIKDKKVSLGELQQYGVIPSYTRIEEDLYLYASFYILPAPPPLAKKATLKPEKYKDLKPYVQESLACTPSAGKKGYYIKAGAFGFYAAMAVQTEDPFPFLGHFHLVPECRDSKQHVYQTDSVVHLDGMKIYLPMEDKTIVFSTSIIVLGGAVAFFSQHFGSPESKAQSYGLGGLSEMLMVLKSQSQRHNPRGEMSLRNDGPRL